MATSSLFLSVAEKLVRHPKRIVFPEGTNAQVVRAAARYAHLRLGPVVLLGKPELIKRQAKIQKVDLDRVMVLDPVEGQDRQMFKDQGLNRAKVRVAADLSGEGLEDIRREEAVEQAMANEALREFEIELGMVSPETSGVTADDKELGTGRVSQTAG